MPIAEHVKYFAVYSNAEKSVYCTAEKFYGYS